MEIGGSGYVPSNRTTSGDNLAWAPTVVHIPAGSRTATFTITTETAFTTDQTLTVTATYSAVTLQATLTVRVPTTLYVSLMKDSERSQESRDM